MMTEGQKSKTQTMKNIDHTGYSGILAKSHYALAVLVNHFLVIDQSNVLRNNFRSTVCT